MVAFLVSYFQERARVQEALNRKGLAPDLFNGSAVAFFGLSDFYAP